ncbi:MAG: Fic family protein [Acidobacteria bacterium]|nr:Fic family protein [Acidobacteriota bacterium]MBI3657763.1 Fic family protein [Acidobacteriota bacterium]
MSYLSSAQQFKAIEEARSELARARTSHARWAEKVDQFFEEEAVVALTSDSMTTPDSVAERTTVQQALAGKPVSDAAIEARILNARRAYHYLLEFSRRGQELEEALLPALHKKLGEGLDPFAGQYRTEPVKPILPGHTPTSPNFIRQALYNTFDWTGSASFAELHAVEQAALLTTRLLEIQPFADGNLKAAPLFASFPLVKHGFPLIIFDGHTQPRFLRALSAAFRLSMQEMIDLYDQSLLRLLEQAKVVCIKNMGQ